MIPKIERLLSKRSLFDKSLWTPLRICFLALIILSYIFLHNHYMAEYIDDPWTLSWAHNFWEKGEVFDTVFGLVDGDGGTALFSRTYVYVYGAFSQIFGWTRGGSYLLSTLILLGSAIIWRSILVKLGFSKELSLDFFLITILLDPYFGMAHKARVDSLGFFLCTFSLWLFINRRYFFSGLVLLVAFETHPVGVVALFYILGYLFTIRKEMKENPKFYIKGALLFIAGCIVGIGYYLLIHWPYLSNLSDLSGRAGGNAFISYFFLKRFSWRHWPELILILFSLPVFLIKKTYRKYPIVLVWIIAIVIGSLVLNRSNNHYVVYFYPPFILLLLCAFRELKLSRLLLIGVLFFQIPQYGYLLYKQHDYNHKAFVLAVREVVEEDPDLFVYGNFNGWFALNDCDYHCYGYFSRAKLDDKALPDHFVLIESPLFFEEKWFGEDFYQLVEQKENREEFQYQIIENRGIPWIGNETVTVKEYIRK